MAKYKKKEKPYCPYTMVRYDNSPSFGHRPVWVCKMCLKFLLTAEAASSHFEICNVRTYHEAQPTPPPTPPPSPTHDISFDTNGYVCEVCNMVFSRRVILKKHAERHEKTNDSDDNDN